MAHDHAPSVGDGHTPQDTDLGVSPLRCPEKGNSSPRGALTHSAHNAMHTPALGCPMGSITGGSDTQPWQRSPNIGLTGYDVYPTIPTDGESATSFTRAFLVPGGSLAATPYQLQGVALDGPDEVDARESPPQPQYSVSTDCPMGSITGDSSTKTHNLMGAAPASAEAQPALVVHAGPSHAATHGILWDSSSSASEFEAFLSTFESSSDRQAWLRRHVVAPRGGPVTPTYSYGSAFSADMLDQAGAMLDSMIDTGRVTVLPDAGCEATFVLTGTVQVCKLATFVQHRHMPHLEDVPPLVDAYDASGRAASCINGFIRGHTARLSVEWKLVKHQWLEQAAKRTLAAVLTSIRERAVVRCMRNREVEQQARRAVRQYESMLWEQRTATRAAAALQWIDTAKRWPGGPPTMVQVRTPQCARWVEARPTPTVGTKRSHQDVVHELSLASARTYWAQRTAATTIQATIRMNRVRHPPRVIKLSRKVANAWGTDGGRRVLQGQLAYLADDPAQAMQHSADTAMQAAVGMRCASIRMQRPGTASTPAPLLSRAQGGVGTLADLIQARQTRLYVAASRIQGHVRGHASRNAHKARVLYTARSTLRCFHLRQQGGTTARAQCSPLIMQWYINANPVVVASIQPLLRLCTDIRGPNSRVLSQRMEAVQQEAASRLAQAEAQQQQVQQCMATLGDEMLAFRHTLAKPTASQRIIPTLVGTGELQAQHTGVRAIGDGVLVFKQKVDELEQRFTASGVPADHEDLLRFEHLTDDESSDTSDGWMYAPHMPDDLAWASTIRDAKAHWDSMQHAMQHLAPPQVVTAAATAALTATAAIWHFNPMGAAAAVICKCEARLPQVFGNSVLGKLGKLLCVLYPSAATAIWHHVKVQQAAQAGSPTHVLGELTMADASTAWGTH